jgi:hypothetical protein
MWAPVLATVEIAEQQVNPTKPFDIDELLAYVARYASPQQLPIS